MQELDGKAIVITGAGRGIGAACAVGLAQAGASLVINDIDSGPLEETLAKIRDAGGKAVGCVADISNWEDAGRIIATCIDSFGKIDGLWNNAALLHNARLDEFDPVASQRLIDVNILGTLYPTAHAIKPMIAQRSGTVLNVTSGAHTGMESMGIYGATKGAVASMTYTWAMELAQHNIRVNALSPLGLTRHMDIWSAYSPGKEAEARRANLPSPDGPMPLVAYLLSDRSRGVTGQLVRIDRREISLYVHPSLQMPPAIRDDWTVTSVAEAFDTDFSSRLVPCGVCGIEGNSRPLEEGFWKRVEVAD